MLPRITLLLLLVEGAISLCDCLYKNQPPTGYDINTWSTFYIQNPFDDSGNACNATCTYLLNSTDPNNGISKFGIIQWDSSPGTVGNTLAFYNTDANGNKIGDPFAVTNGSKPVDPFVSKTQYLVLELNVTSSVHILATLQPVVGVATTPAPATTTTTVPTTPYAGPYANNPALISNDLLIMVDAGAGKSQAAFDQTKQLAASIVEFLSNVITAKAPDAPATGTRLAVNSLTKINTQSLVTPWNADVPTVSNTLKNLASVFSFSADYTQAITEILPPTPKTGPFGIANSGTDEFMNSRQHAQRMLLIVSANVPDDTESIVTNTKKWFTAYDVHPVLIAYNLSPNDDLNKLKSNGWDVYYAQNNSDATVKDFVNTRLVQSDTVCGDMQSQDFTVGSDPFSLKVPSTYQGPSDSTTAWDISPQLGRYCNFQKLTYNFNVADSKATTCFTVYYELETDKDILQFQDSQGNHLVSFTGSDVSGSKFNAQGNVKAIFTTNESQVFGGFSVNFVNTAC